MTHFTLCKIPNRYVSFPHIARLPSGNLAVVFRQASEFSARAARNAAMVFSGAYAAAHPWILILEDRRTLGPAHDAAHYHRCLTALAELP